MTSPADYFAKQVPEAWNQRLAEQVRATDAESAALLQKMRDANFVLEIEVSTGEAFHLFVRNGEMGAEAAASTAPLLTLSLTPEEMSHLEANIGASPMALLGGVGGMPEFIITPSRLEGLRDIEGTLRVEVAGDDPWGVTLHFGPPPTPDPTCTVTIPEAEFRGLISGELDLQGAFMTGKLNVEGDVEIPMKMAMAIMSPE